MSFYDSKLVGNVDYCLIILYFYFIKYNLFLCNDFLVKGEFFVLIEVVVFVDSVFSVFFCLFLVMIGGF